MKKIGKMIMFLSSYSPLYVFIITLNFNLCEIKSSLFKITNLSLINRNDIILYTLILLIIIPNIILKKMIKESSSYSETVKITSIDNGDNKILDYILAYIVTFMTTNYVNLKDSNSNVIITGILIQLLLGYLYCKANMFYINPVLNLIYGYHIFIASTDKKNIIILSKKENNIYDIKKDISESTYKRIRLKYFSKGIYIYK